jgi:uncharacterized protein
LSRLALVGVEDGSFEAFKPGVSTLICAVCLVGERVEWVRLSRVTVDGREATGTLLSMLRSTVFDALILGGVSFAGFNVVDPYRIRDELGFPVIVYSGEDPDSRSTLAALKSNFPDWVERWAPIERLGDVYSAVTKGGAPPVFFEAVGCTREWAEEVLKASVSLTRAPEPVRMAGIIARGLTRSA